MKKEKEKKEKVEHLKKVESYKELELAVKQASPRDDLQRRLVKQQSKLAKEIASEEDKISKKREKSS